MLNTDRCTIVEDKMCIKEVEKGKEIRKNNVWNNKLLQNLDAAWKFNLKYYVETYMFYNHKWINSLSIILIMPWILLVKTGSQKLVCSQLNKTISVGFEIVDLHLKGFSM